MVNNNNEVPYERFCDGSIAELSTCSSVFASDRILRRHYYYATSRDIIREQLEKFHDHSATSIITLRQGQYKAWAKATGYSPANLAPSRGEQCERVNPSKDKKCSVACKNESLFARRSGQTFFEIPIVTGSYVSVQRHTAAGLWDVRCASARRAWSPGETATSTRSVYPGVH